MNDEQMIEALAHYLRASVGDIGQWHKLLAIIHAKVPRELSDVVSELLTDTAQASEGDLPPYIPAPPRPPLDRALDLTPYQALDDVSPLFGSLWTTTLADDAATAGLHMNPPSVVILSPPTEPQTDNSLVQVAPLSDWTRFAANDDLLLPESSGHDHVMVQLWNEQPIQRAQLHHVFGVLSAQEMEWLTALWLARRGGETAASVPAHALGTPLRGATDIRALFREFETLRGQLFSIPARQAFASKAEPPASAPQGIAIPFPYPQDLFAPAERELAHAAATGQPRTPCVIHTATQQNVLHETAPPDTLLARCISFDELMPAQTDPICCEWIFPCPYGTNTPEKLYAQVFDKITEQLVGTATAHVQGTDYLILLNQHQLEPDAEPIRDPQQLRILLREQAPS